MCKRVNFKLQHLSFNFRTELELDEEWIHTVPAFDPQQQQQASRESSSTWSTFATRGEGGGAERRERMGVTARIGVAMGEARGGARMWVQQLGERMKRLGDGAKRWLWRDAG